MSLNQREDFNGRIAKRIKLADKKEISPREMISVISKGDAGIDEYFSQRIEKKVENHESMLNDFQL